jgi:signal transduction histidine kinase
MDDLLAFSRITTRELNLNNVNTNEVVLEVLSEFKGILDSKTKVILEDLISINADFALIYLMFTHLISNAIKFSANVATPEIEISSYKDGVNIIFVVKDNGVGLDMNKVDQLFIKFNKYHDPLLYDGTGMGLAIVNRIVTKHKGKVWMESKPHQGASVFCSFPIGN